MIPVGKPGDIIHLPDFCEICKRHFLIEEELREHYDNVHAKELVLDVLREMHDLEDK